MAIKRYLIALNTKKRHWRRNETRGEVGLSLYFKEGDVPCIFKKYVLSMVNVVIFGVKESSFYGLTLRRFFIVDNNLSGLKSHDIMFSSP
jgi:hypothetical protein